MTDAELGVVGTLAGALVGAAIGFGLTEITRHLDRSRLAMRRWAGLRAEVEKCATDGQGFLADDVQAPLWRFHRAAYDAAIADVSLTPDEQGALADFYGTVDQLNRGLQQAAEARSNGNMNLLQQEHARNRMKAKKIIREGGGHYSRAHAVLVKHLV